MRTLLSSPCQLGLGVVLRHHSLSSYKEQEKVFKKLKKVFTVWLVLVAPDLDKEIRVEADISEYATEV